MAALHEADAPAEASPALEPKSAPKKSSKRKGRKAKKPSSPTASKAAAASVRVSAEQLPRKTLEQALRVPKALRDVHAGGPAEWSEIARATGLSLSQTNKYFLWAAQAYGLVEKDGE